MKEIKLSYEQLDIVKQMIINEIEYYEEKEDKYKEDYEYLDELKKIKKAMESD